ncbi:MAG: CHRD domain-containing protein [Balneolaceae bacterium]|nr:CHRD domain-containing protein [Balneolaceae bacterium]MBO6547895.1 CHRD domain-containing protein [Balneolaceae bacterium]MBO6648408.1 CHRD domain-containing protein [Balneolaceae bacterium]
MKLLKQLRSALFICFAMLLGFSQVSIAQTMFKANLSGSNETPSITSPAWGTITGTLTGTQLVVEGNFEGLVGDYSASHIHLGMAGEAGGVLFSLTAVTDVDNKGGDYVGASNTFNLTSGQVDTLNARGLYINIHSSEYPGGELRAQLQPDMDAHFRANLSGAFEVTPTKSNATGAVVLELDADTLYVSGSFSGLTGDYSASHLHIAPIGEGGGVAFALTPTVAGDSRSGTYFAVDNKFTLTAQQKQDLWDRKFYVNVHSATFGAGEVRGQITPPVTASFYGKLSGTGENPSVNSAGTGAVLIELSGDSLFVSGAFQALGSEFTGAHIHTGHAGISGDVAVALTASLEAGNIAGSFLVSDNRFELTSQQKTDLLNRNMYVNVHSQNNAPGELRAQILGDASAYFHTHLLGIHEVQPVDKSGYGSAIVELTGSRAIVSGGFQSLDGDFTGSHIHAAKADANGDVSVVLTPSTNTVGEMTEGEFEVSSNTYTFTSAQIDSIFNESFYVNIHSSSTPSGELRGQLLFDVANTYPEPPSLTFPGDGDLLELSTTASTALEVTWGHDGIDGDDNKVVYIWQLATDENFNDVVVNANVGTEQKYATTHGDFNMLLADLGVVSGGETMLYHRAFASDGSDLAASDTFMVSVQRPDFGSEVYEILLSGSNEVPPITSQAYGKVTAVFNGTHLVLDGEFEGLSGDFTGAHLHFGQSGQAGGVEVAVSPNINGDMTSGTFADFDTSYALTPDQISKLHSRALYLNIHSSAHPGGELRGQVVPKSDYYFRTNFSGAFQAPPFPSMASGAATLELTGDTLTISGSFSGLSDDYVASHIHIAPVGSSGPVSITLNPVIEVDNRSGVFVAEQNEFILDADQKSALWNREFYINIHVSELALPELRGNITPPVTAAFYATLSGSAENESVEASGWGAMLVEFHKDSLIASGSFDGLESNYSASHIHAGHAGENGGVITGLTADISNDTSGTYASAANTFGLSSDQIEGLFERGMYINIHSADNAGGELRGQVLGDATAYFKTKLNGDHENDPVINTYGYGATNIELAGDRIIVSGGFDQLSSAFSGAHIHSGSVSTNGDVEVALSPTVTNDTTGVFDPAMNTFTVTTDQANAMFMEGTYINVHSSANPGGELRGQLLFGDNFFPSEVEITAPADGAELTISGDAATTFTAEWSKATDPNGNELRYVWAVSSDSEFDEILYFTNVGSDTSATLTFEVLDGLLADLSVGLNASATIYHSVMVTDGSNESFSEPQSVNLTRGMITSNEDDEGTGPLVFGLDQNYPNPFNPSTAISFTLSESGNTTLKVFNMLGQEVVTLANERLSAGSYTYNFDASSLASGMYIYRLQAQNQTVTKRMMLIK